MKITAYVNILAWQLAFLLDFYFKVNDFKLSTFELLLGET